MIRRNRGCPEVQRVIRRNGGGPEGQRERGRSEGIEGACPVGQRVLLDVLPVLRKGS